MKVPDISPRTTYQIQHMCIIYAKPDEKLTHEEKNIKTTRQENFRKEIQEIATYAYRINPEELKPIEKALFGYVFNLEFIIDRHLDLLELALSIYVRDRREADYADLLTKPVVEMSGYEYSVLMSRILGKDKQ